MDSMFAKDRWVAQLKSGASVEARSLYLSARAQAAA